MASGAYGPGGRLSIKKGKDRYRNDQIKYLLRRVCNTRSQIKRRNRLTSKGRDGTPRAKNGFPWGTFYSCRGRCRPTWDRWFANSLSIVGNKTRGVRRKMCGTSVYGTQGGEQGGGGGGVAKACRKQALETSTEYLLRVDVNSKTKQKQHSSRERHPFRLHAQWAAV